MNSTWDITVPADDAELLAELHRRGVRPGAQLHVVVSEPDDDEQAPAFFGSFAAAPDLGKRAKDTLHAEYPSAAQ